MKITLRKVFRSASVVPDNVTHEDVKRVHLVLEVMLAWHPSSGRREITSLLDGAI